MRVIDLDTIELPSGIDNTDINYLYEYLLDFAPELTNTFTALELAKLYHQFSEEVWSASWEDNAEGQFIDWMKN